LEETFEADLDNDNEYRYGQKDDAPDEGSVGVPGRKTKETVTAADAIMDALDTAEEELKRLNQHKLVHSYYTWFHILIIEHLLHLHVPRFFRKSKIMGGQLNFNLML
jgi:hypothetical protein